jgi:hypothetical protein
MKECSSNICEVNASECQSERECHEDDHCSFFIELADCAWVEVLKEKIKEQIRAQDDKALTELAKIVAEGNKKRWKHKMCKKKNCHEFKEKLCSFFNAEK